MTKEEMEELVATIDHWKEVGITESDMTRGYIGEWADELLNDKELHCEGFHLKTFHDMLKVRIKKDVDEYVDSLYESVKEDLGQ